MRCRVHFSISDQDSVERKRHQTRPQQRCCLRARKEFLQCLLQRLLESFDDTALRCVLPLEANQLDMGQTRYIAGHNGVVGKGFEHKLLAEYSVNIGNICEFDCTYCYVPSVTMKQKSVKNIMDQGFQIGKFSSSREMDNVLSTVAKDLKRIKPDDIRTVFF